jgi:hypothetical protein
MSLLHWLFDLVTPVLNHQQWDEKITALKQPGSSGSVKPSPEAALVLHQLEARVRNESHHNHRWAQAAWREFKRETAVVAATGNVSSALQAEIRRARALREEIESTLTASFSRRDPVDRARARASIERLYTVLELPVPAQVIFLEPGLAIDPAALPPPRHADGVKRRPEVPGRPIKGRVIPHLLSNRLHELGVPRGPDDPGMATAEGRAFDRMMKLAHGYRPALPPVAVRTMNAVSMRLGQNDWLDNFLALTLNRPAFLTGTSLELGPGMVFAVARRHGFSMPMPRAAVPLVEAIDQAWADAGFAYCFDGWALVVGRPRVATFDDQARLHNATSPALMFADDRPLHYWHGVEIPAALIEHSEAITAERIKAETNLEIRRVMIERMGAERFVAGMGAQRVHADETGTLWRVELTPPLHIKELFARSNYVGLTAAERQAIEALPEHQSTIQQGDVWQAVEVINSTPEKDGTFKRYFLTVPPEMRTAREAVAWTFGLTAAQYQPQVEK